jgi:hypothetical protein
MAEVNTSLYGAPQAQNPLQQASTAVGVMNALEQNKLLQGQQRMQNIQIDAAKLELVRGQLNAFRNLLAPHINDPQVSHRTLADIGMKAIQQGLTTPQQVANELAGIPRNATPQQVQKYIQNLYVQSLGQEQQINSVLGPIQGVSTGGGTTFVQQPALPNRPVRQRGEIPNTLPPGTPTFNVKEQRPEVVSEGVPGQFQPAAGSPGKPSSSKGTVSAPESPRGPKTLPAAPALGEGEAAVASAGQLAEDRKAAADYRARILPLERVVSILDEVGPRGTGIGSELATSLKNLGVSAGILKSDAAKPLEELKKYYMQNTLQTADTATNEKLLAGITGNPNITLTEASASQLAKVDLALRRMKQAQVMAAIAQKVPEGRYQEFAAQFANRQDPRVYAFDMMKPKERASLLKGMKEPERAKFWEAIGDAKWAGLINPAGLPKWK